MLKQPAPVPESEPWDSPPTGFAPPGYSPDAAPEAQPYAYPVAPTAYPGPHPYPYGPYGYFPKPQTNTLAILSFIFAFVVPPAGFVLGIIALKEIGRSGEGGRGLAVAGLAIGAAITGIFLLYMLFIVVIMLFALSFA